jgi:transcriptional regulator with XRE-family HTH domain
MAVNQEVKKLINFIKFQNNMRQAEVAERVGVKSTYLSDVINGHVPFSQKLKEKIYEAFSDCLSDGLNATIVTGNYQEAKNNDGDVRQEIHTSGNCEAVLREIASLRQLIEEQNRDNVSRFLSIIERLTDKQ